MTLAMNKTHLDVLESGKRTLQLASKYIKSLEHSLDYVFEDVVNIFLKIKGKIVVSGIGKSGHIAKKIAATFASTGQSAIFIHAAEAGHGDLGMVSKDDALLILSYSGDSNELSALINYAHRISIPVVSITGKSSSKLAVASCKTLTLPKLEEACNFNAPTTSTTLMLSLGDAIAVALLNSRGFEKSDFGLLHPLGSLGQQLKQVREIMRKNVPIIKETDNMQHAILEMNEKGIGCTAVISDKNKIVGVITDGDLRRHISLPNLLELIVKDVMTEKPSTISSDALMGDALAIMEKKSITSLFVVNEDQRIEGVLHIHDCLQKILFK